MKTALVFLAVIFSITAFADERHGRFNLVNTGKLFVLVDSQTGKMWRQSCLLGTQLDCDFPVWIPEEIVGITSTIESTKQKLERIKTGKSDAH